MIYKKGEKNKKGNIWEKLIAINNEVKTYIFI